MTGYFPPLDVTEQKPIAIEESRTLPGATAALRQSMAKTLKTADELREMILDRARESRIFPPGMSVHIRRIRTSWGIDCVPPTISKAAHTDCCELLTNIANQLREEYDLEPLNRDAAG